MEHRQTDIPPEAKQAAEAYAQGKAGVNATASGLPIPPAAIVLLHQGKFIEAVKSTRIETGLGLKESKEAVECFLAEDPVTREQFRAAGGRTGLGPRMIAAMALLMVAAVLGVIYLSGAWR